LKDIAVDAVVVVAVVVVKDGDVHLHSSCSICPLVIKVPTTFRFGLFSLHLNLIDVISTDWPSSLYAMLAGPAMVQVLTKLEHPGTLTDVLHV